jgi:hypothetical protein
MDLADRADRKRCVRIAGAAQERDRDAAVVPVSGKAEISEWVMAEGRRRASTEDAALVEAADSDSDAAEVSVTVLAGVKECILVAVHHLGLAENGGPAKVEALDSAPVGDVDSAAAEDGDRGRVEVPVSLPAAVTDGIPIVALDFLSAGAADLAPTADRNPARAEGPDLAPTQIERRLSGPEQALGSDGAEDLARAVVRDSDSAPADARIPKHPPRPSWRARPKKSRI